MRTRFQFIHLCYAAGLALAVIAIVAITKLGASRQDAQYLATQGTIANAEVEDAYTYLRGQVRQMVYWQDAFDNTVKRWNEVWVTYQFGAYQDSMENFRTILADAHGNLRFLHAPRGETALSRDNLQQAKGLKHLLQRVVKAGVHQPPPMVSGAVVSGGKPYFAIASLVTPETESDIVVANRAPVAVVFLSPITPARFVEFAKGFDATDIHIVVNGDHRDGHREFALVDATGTPVAWLHWKPHLPGADFLRQVAFPLGVVLITFMLIQVLVITRWLALQRGVLAAQAEARTATEQSRLKSVFLGTISHELRTPLNAIIGYADVLCCQLFGPLGNPRNAEYVRDIRASGRNLLKTVNDLIEIARIEAEDSCQDRAPFDASLAARRAITALQDRIDAKSLRVKLVHADRPAVCHGSLIGLSQAVERILSNAVRATPEGGDIAITLHNDGRNVAIEIRDHGSGISPERLADLTRPFSHSDNHLVATGKGMGFGIPIARGLLQLMGGSIVIDSTPGVGTVVRMTLPAGTLPASEIPRQRAHHTAAAVQGKR